MSTSPLGCASLSGRAVHCPNVTLLRRVRRKCTDPASHPALRHYMTAPLTPPFSWLQVLLTELIRMRT